MAERIVHVLEMVEIDVEHGRRRSAALDVLDHRLQPLAEIVAVRQSAQRIVQGEIAQAVFARGDGRGGAPHVAVDERGEKREAGERDGDERDDAVHDLGAGPLRRPGEARDRLAALVGEVEHVIVRRDRCRAPILRRFAQLQAVRRSRPALFVDEFDGDHDRRGLPFAGVGDRRSAAIRTAATIAGRPRKCCTSARGAPWRLIGARGFRNADRRGQDLRRRGRAHSRSVGASSGRIELNQRGSTLARPSRA